MGQRTCPRCGTQDRSHEVKVQVRSGGAATKIDGTGIKVCAGCAVEIRDEIRALLDGARQGEKASLDREEVRLLDEDRRDRERIGEINEDGLVYQGDGEWRAAE
jgi:hypothetical protein